MNITESKDTLHSQSNVSQESQKEIARLVITPSTLSLPLKTVNVSAFSIQNQMTMSHIDKHGFDSSVNRCVVIKRGKSHSPMPVNKYKITPILQKSISLFIDGNFLFFLHINAYYLIE
jgi:hypothetical protein